MTDTADRRYNCMGIRHMCTYLSHVPGDQHDKVLKELTQIREENRIMKEALEKIAEYHFDGNKSEGACGGGCDMGYSGRKTDNFKHDVDCIFGVARSALERTGDK